LHAATLTLGGGAPGARFSGTCSGGPEGTDLH
jgi:hypothetical protein